MPRYNLTKGLITYIAPDRSYIAVRDRAGGALQYFSGDALEWRGGGKKVSYLTSDEVANEIDCSTKGGRGEEEEEREKERKDEERKENGKKDRRNEEREEEEREERRRETKRHSIAGEM